MRQALIDATINAEANNIAFSIPTSDPGYDLVGNRFTISLFSPLPDLPLAALNISNDQPQAVTVKGNNTFRIFTLVNSAVVTINNLTISNGFSGLPAVQPLKGGSDNLGGTDGLGGGIYMSDSSTLNLTRSVVSDNTSANGGGIYINVSGTLNCDSNTVSNNTATTGNGGGLFNNVSGTINANNNTLDGNFVGGDGGGVYNTATITLTNNTVSGNTANRGGGIYNNFTATLNSNLVALNAAIDGTDLLGRGSLGNAFTGVFNLIGNADGSEGVSGAPNRAGTTALPINPLLGALQKNGGPTFTRALVVGSPAIDKGNSLGVILDQRGQVRPFDNLTISNDGGNGADIGAYEVRTVLTAANATLSGSVLRSSIEGAGIPKVTVYLTDLNGNIQIAHTNSFGYFYFAHIAAGEIYIIRAEHKSYRLAPQVISIFDDVTELNIIALDTN